MSLHVVFRHRIAAALGFFFYGAFALISQILCLQELEIVFSGNELLLGISLAAWMCWVGAGSFLSSIAKTNRLSLLASWLIFLLLANLLAIRLTKCLFGFGMLTGLLPMLLFTVMLLMPVGLAIGAIFSWGYELARTRCDFNLAHVYLWDALGTAFGGLAYSLFISGRLMPEQSIVYISIPLALIVYALSYGKKARLIACASSIIFSLFVVASPLPHYSRVLQWRGYQLLAQRYSRYEHLVLAKTGSINSLFENGVISANFPDSAAYEELVHIPLLAHNDPRRVLIIGGASTGSLSEALKHPVMELDMVELDSAIIELVKPQLSIEDRNALMDNRLRLLHIDGRRFLAQKTKPYDVILLQLPAPINAQINRLYTIEAFRAIQKHLAVNGLFAFAIPSSENYLSAENAYFNASIYRTLKAAFPNVDVVAGSTLLLLASRQGISLDIRQLASRYISRRIVTREVVPSYFPIKLDKNRRYELLKELSIIRTPINRDLAPVCYTYAWRVWMSKFVSPFYFLGALMLLASAAALLLALWKKRSLLLGVPATTALFALGAAGMVYEIVLLLAFQSFNGYVYWQLGSLFASFMLGLFAGSAITRALKLNKQKAQVWLYRLLVSTGLLGLAFGFFLPAIQKLTIALTWFSIFAPLLAITGILLGLAFPIASIIDTHEPPIRTAGSLYAADLWGGALGALLTSTFLIPLFGLPVTSALSGAVLLLLSIFFFQQKPKLNLCTPTPKIVVRG